MAIGSTTGEITDAVNAGETAKVAVEDNQMLVPQAYNILNAQEKKLYYKLKQNGAPELTVFVNAYNNCTTNSCREKVENSHIRASNAFGKNVLKLAKNRKLNLVEMQMLLDNLSHKFAKASDGIKNDNSISNMETRHWTALGILGFSNELTEALSTARINYLYYDKGLRGDALVSQFKKDALTQELSLGLPIYTGVGGPPVFKRKNASQPVYTKPGVSSNKDSNRTPEGYEPDNDLLSNQKNKNIYDEKTIKSAEDISTAKSNKNPPQVASPRNIQKQVLWNHVVKNPQQGQPLKGMNNDKRFPSEAGFQKMQAIARGNDGKNIVIHYQYNNRTNKAYDIKIVSKE